MDSNITFEDIVRANDWLNRQSNEEAVRQATNPDATIYDRSTLPRIFDLLGIVENEHDWTNEVNNFSRAMVDEIEILHPLLKQLYAPVFASILNFGIELGIAAAKIKGGELDSDELDESS